MMQPLPGSLNSLNKKITIWGAGFSGLVLGYYLKKNGFRIKIYEKSSRVGGKIRTKRNSFGLSETGANALFMNQDAIDLIKDLQLEPIPASQKLKKLILINGKPKKALQLKVLLKVISRAYARPPLISDGLTVADFFRPLLGDEIIHQLLSPALGGVYSTPAEKLHFKSIFEIPNNIAQFNSYWLFFKTLLNKRKQNSKLEIKGSISFEGGMQVLIDKLYSQLKDDIVTNNKKPFTLNENTIICTDAHSAADLLEDKLPAISKELRRINYQSLSSTTVFLKREIRNLNNAFGILIPAETNMKSIGVVNNKAVFPINNSNVYSYTLISKQRMEESDISSDLKILNHDFVPEDIEHTESHYWEKAIPIYDLQRYLSIKKIDEILSKNEGLVLFGNYVNGISLREMITLSKNLATSLSENQNLNSEAN
jgi:oxygen-dependent protoporphyrinogen oxidase